MSLKLVAGNFLYAVAASHITVYGHFTRFFFSLFSCSTSPISSANKVVAIIFRNTRSHLSDATAVDLLRVMVYPASACSGS